MQVGGCGGELSGARLDDELVAAHRADARGGNADELRALDEFHGVERLAGNDDAALRFAEEQGVEADVFERREINARADQSRGFAGDLLADAALGERDGQAAIAAIMRALDQAGLDEAKQRGVQFLLPYLPIPCSVPISDLS